MKLIKGSYSPEDCTFLLSDLTGEIDVLPAGSLDDYIASGHHYSDCITEEQPVSDEINRVFDMLLSLNADKIARYIEQISKCILRDYDKPVLVSLARAGTPIGVLVKRYLSKVLGVEAPHYSISIIRDKGIDMAALDTIRKECPDGQMVFIDGWTGRGSITAELHKTLGEYYRSRGVWITPAIVVLADPAKVADIYGTREDICIPNACLNSTVSGLVSRTICNKKYLDKYPYHGAIVYNNLKYQDKSLEFIETIEKAFRDDIDDLPARGDIDNNYIVGVLNGLIDAVGDSDVTRYKLSIGEASRALIRRNPERILLKDINDPQVAFIKYLAEQRGIPISNCCFGDYKCIAVLKAKGK